MTLKTYSISFLTALLSISSVYADEACDDAIADGKAAYNNGNYSTAQKHFENVVKWCGGSYGAASNWVQNCKNKQAEIKRAQEQKRQEQKNREQQAQLERKASTNTVTDCQGHTYPVVKIGNQYWMAENLQCTKYDTQSERAGATLSTSSSSTYAPYYTDGRNATTEYSGNLTSSQRKKLGLLYNWAATVGLATESEAKNRTTAFSGRRQGICPNGWHIPTDAEWVALGIALGGTKDSNGHFSDVGKRLKTTSGWYGGGHGTDDYSFAALPAGYAAGSSVHSVGKYNDFWTATPDDDGSAYSRSLGCGYDSLLSSEDFKGSALSVRCIRN